MVTQSDLSSPIEEEKERCVRSVSYKYSKQVDLFPSLDHASIQIEHTEKSLK